MITLRILNPSRHTKLETRFISVMNQDIAAINSSQDGDMIYIGDTRISTLIDMAIDHINTPGKIRNSVTVITLTRQTVGRRHEVISEKDATKSKHLIAVIEDNREPQRP